MLYNDYPGEVDEDDGTMRAAEQQQVSNDVSNDGSTSAERLNEANICHPMKSRTLEGIENCCKGFRRPLERQLFAEIISATDPVMKLQHSATTASLRRNKAIPQPLLRG